MAITHTGTNITGVTNTSTVIDSVTHTGTVVFEPAPTANPSIVGAVCQIIGGSKHIVFRIRNNDASSAVINYGSISTVPQSAGTIGSGAQTSQLDIGPYSGSGSATVYARATASGKPQSMVVSQSVSYSLCGL